MNRSGARRALGRVIKARRALEEAYRIARRGNADTQMLGHLKTAGESCNGSIRRLCLILPNAEITLLNDHERRVILGYSDSVKLDPTGGVAGATGENKDV